MTPEQLAARERLDKAMGEGCGDYYCNYCECHQVLVDEICRLGAYVEELEKKLERSAMK